MIEADRLVDSPQICAKKEPEFKKENTVFEQMDWDLHFNEELVASKTQCVDKTNPLVNAVFRWKEGGEKVFLAGSYDNWSSKLPFTRTKSEFMVVRRLPLGRHEYKYLVDGQWRVHEGETVCNSEVAGRVNVLTVQCHDADVFVALAEDESKLAKTSKHDMASGWTQELPARGSGYLFSRSGPHLLPPQLSQSVLNSETQVQCDPTILLQPPHVTLNHLYTLSIKDGVLVMASTYRYRKKFITTVIYKPI